MTATITVKNCFGDDKQVTKEEFVSTWVYQVKDLWALCETDEEYDLADQIKDQVRKLAERDFERTVAKQEK